MCQNPASIGPCALKSGKHRILLVKTYTHPATKPKSIEPSFGFGSYHSFFQAIHSFSKGHPSRLRAHLKIHTSLIELFLQSLFCCRTNKTEDPGASKKQTVTNIQPWKTEIHHGRSKRKSLSLVGPFVISITSYTAARQGHAIDFAGLPEPEQDGPT